MPTCSQAKIITNLESSDLNRRLFSLVMDSDTTKSRSLTNVAATTNNNSNEMNHHAVGTQHVESCAFELDSRQTFPSSQQQQQQQQSTIQTHSLMISKPQGITNNRQHHRLARKHDCVSHKHHRPSMTRTVSNGFNQLAQGNIHNESQQQSNPTVRVPRKVTINEIPQHQQNPNPYSQLQQPYLATSTREPNNFQLLKLHKVPIVFGEVSQPNRRNPFGVLTNPSSSKIRQSQPPQQQQQQILSSFMNNQMRINMLRSELNLNLMSQQQRQNMMYNNNNVSNRGGAVRPAWCSDGDEEEFENEDEQQQSSSSTPSSGTATSMSAASCSDGSSQGQNNNNNNGGQGGTRSLVAASLAARKRSYDFWQCLPIRSKRNSIEESTAAIKQLPGIVGTDALNVNNSSNNNNNGCLGRRNSLVGLNNLNQINAAMLALSNERSALQQQQQQQQQQQVSHRVRSLNLPKLALDVDPSGSHHHNHHANSLLYSQSSNLRHVSSHGLLLEPTGGVNAVDDNNNNNNESPSSNSSTSRRITLDQAKRLLALASIRPSKTFHKSMTDEEIEVLKKYYELMKPKGVNGMSAAAVAAAAEAAERAKYENSPPVVYNTAKLNSNTLVNLRTFLEHYKKDIDSGEYALEFDQSSEESTGRFVLKSTSRSSASGSGSSSESPQPTSIRFPDELNDALVAFAVNTGDRENRTLGEANLFRIINWNDTSTTNTTSTTANTTQANKSRKPKTSDDQQQQQLKQSSSSPQQLLPNIAGATTSVPGLRLPLSPSSSSSLSPPSSSSPNSSTLSFEYIRNLSSLINSILEPKIVKQLTYTGVDVGALPGSVNFDMPSFEELGIDLEGLLSKYGSGSNNNNGGHNGGLLTGGYDVDLSNNKADVEFQSSKLKSSAYKKLREKVAKSKVMWFPCAPERRPLSVIFELPTSDDTGGDLGHQMILDEVNAYVQHLGGRVEGVEFVPRSVLLNSVYVDNMWIVTLNDSNTKFYTINNGIEIRGRKYAARSYDEFIFAEYEKFVKTEKYKQLIRNHEKAVQTSQSRKTSKK